MSSAVHIKFLEPNLVWSMALYAQADRFSFADELIKPIKVFDSKKLRTKIKHVHTRADPFLFVWGDELFLFFESMSIKEVGCIAVYKTTDLKNFDYLGVVLKESHHLSYPLVFNHGSSVFMIPESGAAEEVALYRFENFPYGLNKVRTLLKGKYFDSSLIFHHGLWYLFTNSEFGLEIFLTDDIEQGSLLPHAENPVTADPRISRCGGQPVVVAGNTFRIAQDCSKKYGGNVNILRILELTPDRYREELAYEGYFGCREKWNAEGGHHLSLTNFRGRTVIAVDGHHRDYLLNKVLSPFFGALAKATPEVGLRKSVL